MRVRVNVQMRVLSSLICKFILQYVGVCFWMIDHIQIYWIYVACVCCITPVSIFIFLFLFVFLKEYSYIIQPCKLLGVKIGKDLARKCSLCFPVQWHEILCSGYSCSPHIARSFYCSANTPGFITQSTQHGVHVPVCAVIPLKWRSSLHSAVYVEEISTEA